MGDSPRFPRGYGGALAAVSTLGCAAMILVALVSFTHPSGANHGALTAAGWALMKGIGLGATLAAMGLGYTALRTSRGRPPATLFVAGVIVWGATVSALFGLLMV